SPCTTPPRRSRTAPPTALICSGSTIASCAVPCGMLHLPFLQDTGLGYPQMHSTTSRYSDGRLESTGAFSMLCNPVVEESSVQRREYVRVLTSVAGGAPAAHWSAGREFAPAQTLASPVHLRPVQPTGTLRHRSRSEPIGEQASL